MTDSPIPPTAPAPPSTGTAPPDPHCPLCRMWSAYVKDPRGAAMAPILREHSFMVAGYWLGLMGDELGDLCKAHDDSVAQIEAQNQGAEPAPVIVPPTGVTS